MVTVWKGCVGVGEPCLLCVGGNYYGINTRTMYPAGEYRHSPVYLARVVQMLDANETGMYYRDERDHRDVIGQVFEVEQAHYYGVALVWRTLRERYYLHELEIELLTKEPIR